MFTNGAPDMIESNTHERARLAAQRLFGEHGYAATSLRSVAEELDVTKAALYYHYPSKDDLLEAVVGPALTAIDELITDEQLDPAQLLRSYAELLLEHREVIVFVTRDIAVASETPIGERLDRQFEQLRSRLAGADASDAAHVTAAAALGAMWRPVVALQDTDLEDHLDLLVDAALGVLKANRVGAPEVESI